MRFLSQAAFQRARAFVMNGGRRLDQQLWAFHFESGARGDVLAALAAYQNADGGYCRIEPDVQTETSSALATTVGFQTLREVGSSSKEIMVQQGIRFLLDTLDPEAKVWRIVPPEVEDAPHAPWWNYEKTEEAFGGFLSNPRAEILAAFWEYSDLVPGDVRNELADSVLTHLEVLPDKLDMNDFLCYQRLAQAKNFSETGKERVLKKLLRAAPHTVATDPSRWSSYCFKPLLAAPDPGNPLAELLAEDVQRNLDFEIESQNSDGSWSPSWSWGDRSPEGWEQALMEWKSHLTLQTALSLEAYGRIEGIR